jgi:tRNA (guanine37-N1)-methyltransferase
VPKQQGEAAIALVGKLALMDRSLSVGQQGGEICIPLTRQPQSSELQTIKTQLPKFELAEAVFIEKTPACLSLTQALEGRLPADLAAKVPQAFDIVGDIVVIDIPAQLKPHQALIGEAIMQTHRNVHTVLAKAGDIGGVYRTRDYTVIAGEERTRTIHREFGCTFHVDLAKAYFSPRLSHEHWRVASLVGADEVVADLFAGVGPFSVLIGKRRKNVKVYAVDLNPDAVELLKENVAVNHVETSVFPIQADAREIARGSLRGVADRVIMNLPETAIDFVDAACNALKPQGGVVHFYCFVRSPDSIDDLKRRFSTLVEQNRRSVETFLYAKSIRETAPFESQVALDAKII